MKLNDLKIKILVVFVLALFVVKSQSDEQPAESNSLSSHRSPSQVVVHKHHR